MPNELKKTTVIFDFDSTLAESLPEVKKIFIQIAQDLNYPQITPKLIDRLIHREIKEVLRELKFPIFKLAKMEKLFRQKIKLVIKNIKPFPEIKKTIKELKKLGYPLGILSSNSQENVLWFLKKYQMNDFNFIDGGSGFFGKAKRLKKLLKKEKLKRDEVIYIGDETRDIFAAQKNKVRVISVTWGVNPKSVLTKYHPDWLADKPADLLKIIKKFC